MTIQPELQQPAVSIARRPDGQLVVVTGCGGSGKTVFAMMTAAPCARLVVWDSHLQWSAHGCRPIYTIAELARACSSKESAHLAYIGPTDRKSFEKFCRIALLWLKLEISTTVIEELADVSEPGKARGAWGELVRWNRKLGGTLLALTQFPAETDKTILRNAQRIVCHALDGETDEIYMAKLLRVDPSELASLRIQKLEHIERRADRSTVRGFTPLPRKKSGISRSKSRSV